MRSSIIFLLILICYGCGCDGPTCPQPTLQFRVVDSNNKDLQYDLNIPVDSLILKPELDPAIEIFKVDPKYNRKLRADLNPYATEYTLSYRDRHALLTVKFGRDTTKCCDQGYDFVEALKVNGETATEETVDQERIYVITL